MRQFKHHEQKLLRKVNLYQWKGDDNMVRSGKDRMEIIRSKYLGWDGSINITTLDLTKLGTSSCMWVVLHGEDLHSETLSDGGDGSSDPSITQYPDGLSIQCSQSWLIPPMQPLTP